MVQGRFRPQPDSREQQVTIRRKPYRHPEQPQGREGPIKTRHLKDGMYYSVLFYIYSLLTCWGKTMKIKVLYLIAALGLCSEGLIDSTVFFEDISTESSSSTDSSSSIQDSSATVSSSVSASSSSNQVSSSSTTSSSFSSSATHSSSSNILQRSSSSKKHNDMVDPGIPLSSSGSDVAIPLRSLIDSNETRAVNVRLLYPVEDGKLDTGFFPLGQCLLYEDGSFQCKQASCLEEVGGTIGIPYGGITISVNAQNKDSSAYSRYFHESTETTYLFDLSETAPSRRTFLTTTFPNLTRLKPKAI